MGAVYLARREQDGKLVALKSSHGTLGEAGLARLKREGELLARASSPHLPAFVELFPSGDRLVLVMGFVQGEPLHQLWQTHSGSPEGRLGVAQRALPGVARGLMVLHGLGIVHRDLKPANVIVGPEGGVLVDLGLARGPDVRTLTITGLTLGTPDYLPPEQISSERVTDSADLYQVALVLHDLLLGGRRGPGENALDQAVRRSVMRFPDPRGEHPWLPGELIDWMLAALHPDPGARPPTREHLEALLTLLPRARIETPRGTPEPVAGEEVDARTFAAVARHREKARETGWDDAVSLEVLQSGNHRDQQRAPTSVVPGGVGAGAVPAPSSGSARGGGPSSPAPGVSPRSPRAGVAPREPIRSASRSPVGLVLMLLTGLGVGWLGWSSGADSREPASPGTHPLVFALEERRLVLVSGDGADLSLGGDRFTRGQDGGWGLELPARVELPSSVTLEGPGGRQELFLPGPELARRVSLRRSGAGLELRVPVVGPPDVAVALRDRTTRLEGAGPGPWDLVLPPGGPGGDPLELDLGPRTGPWLRTHIDLAEKARETLGDLRVPPLDLAERAGLWAGKHRFTPHEEGLWDPAQERFLRERGPEVGAWLSWPGLDEERRLEVYRSLVPHASLEWMTRRATRPFPWLAGPALGSLLALRASPGFAPLGSGERGFRRDFPLAVRIGPDGRLKQRMGSRETYTPGTWDEAGRFWIELEDVEPGLPTRVELGLQAGGGDHFGVLVLHLGGRELFLPLLEEDLWRYQSIPPRWYQEAVSGDRTLTLGFSFARIPGLVEPSNFFVSRIQLQLAFPREGSGPGA